MNDNIFNLFELGEQESFSEKVSSLTEIDLSRRFPIKILGRAYLYAEDSILATQFQPGEIMAMIFGTAPYETLLQRHNNFITGSCSCPHNEACKHLAALLIHLIQKTTAEELAIIDESMPT